MIFATANDQSIILFCLPSLNIYLKFGVRPHGGRKWKKEKKIQLCFLFICHLIALDNIYISITNAIHIVLYDWRFEVIIEYNVLMVSRFTFHTLMLNLKTNSLFLLYNQFKWFKWFACLFSIWNMPIVTDSHCWAVNEMISVESIHCVTESLFPFFFNSKNQ